MSRRSVLASMRPGEHGRVVRIDGGCGVTQRLDGMGIRPGAGISVLAKLYLRGPVTVAVGRSHVAVGFGMAKKILVETGAGRA